MTRARPFIALLASALIAAVNAPSTAHADVLTRLLTGIERVTGLTASPGMRQLDHAAALARTIVTTCGNRVLAGHIGVEGHWTFVNRTGERFTAGTPEELARAIPTLVPPPEGAASGRLLIVLSEHTVFLRPGALKQLPRDAELRVAVANTSYPIVLEPTGEHLIRIRSSIAVPVGDRVTGLEAIWQLERPLRRARIRIMALDPGGPSTLASTPRLDPATGRTLTDRIAPAHLPAALAALGGQTVVLTGRLAAGRLVFRAGNASEHALPLSDLSRAATAGNVNILILDTPAPRQPGVRNWLWLETEVSGLDAALSKATMGDFLASIASPSGTVLRLTLARAGGRVTLRAEPMASSSPLPDLGIGKMMAEVGAELAGKVLPAAISGDMLPSERQRDYDMRLLPGIPADYQFAYLFALVVGLLGLPRVLLWWRRIWPPEARSDYANRLGYLLARLAKFVCFLFLFLPVVGLPAALLTLASQLITILALPVRIVSWFIGRRTPERAGVPGPTG